MRSFLLLFVMVHSLSNAEAQLIFTRVNWEHNDGGGLGKDDDNPDYELMGHEFLHAIIRIAHSIPALQVRMSCPDAPVPRLFVTALCSYASLQAAHSATNERMKNSPCAELW